MKREWARASINSASVTLYATVNDPAGGSGLYQCRYKNDGSSWSDWENIGAGIWPRSWALDDSRGQRTVSLEVKDRAGNITTVSDDITLNARIVITYDRMIFTDGGDSGSGDIFWAFYIDGALTQFWPRENAWANWPNGIVLNFNPLYTPTSYTIFKHPGSGTILMTGVVKDRDSGADPDDVGYMQQTIYNVNELSSGPSDENRPITGGVSGTVYYTIDLQN